MTGTSRENGFDRGGYFVSGFTLETTPPRCSYPAATTQDSEEADVDEPGPGLWNVRGRLPGVSVICAANFCISCSRDCRAITASSQGRASSSGMRNGVEGVI